MVKKFLILFVTATFFLNCSTSEEKQNLDINVTGTVTNQNNVGIEGVTIFVQRGKPGGFVATQYNTYDTLTTNSNGSYSYLVKDDNFSYQICCGIPAGYTISGSNCTAVDHSIINSHTIPNKIDFELTQ